MTCQYLQGSWISRKVRQELLKSIRVIGLLDYVRLAQVFRTVFVDLRLKMFRAFLYNHSKKRLKKLVQIRDSKKHQFCQVRQFLNRPHRVKRVWLGRTIEADLMLQMFMPFFTIVVKRRKTLSKRPTWLVLLPFQYFQLLKASPQWQVEMMRLLEYSGYIYCVLRICRCMWN